MASINEVIRFFFHSWVGRLKAHGVKGYYRSSPQFKAKKPGLDTKLVKEQLSKQSR
jgi:hypothetical protein